MNATHTMLFLFLCEYITHFFAIATVSTVQIYTIFRCHRVNDHESQCSQQKFSEIKQKTG
jgi:hypothetical protein